MDLIIGAGISGLAYANFCGHDDFLIIEKEHEIGGFCKTVKQDGFVWDYSGHFFHFRNPEIENFILAGIDLASILKVRKHSQILYKGNYIDFPFQKNIHQLDKEEFIDCLYDLFTVETEKFGNFKEMLYAKFGKSIAEKFLIPYNEKLYACDLNQLDKDAMGRFFPMANKVDIVKNFKSSNNDSYNSSFTYPRGGAIEYVNSLYNRISNNKVLLGEELLTIDLENKVAFTNKQSIKYDNLISAIPFPLLLEKCKLDYEKQLYSWNKVLVFNLGFDKKGKDTKNHWVYFPSKESCFYRIGYYDNIFGDDRMSLYVELGFDKDVNIDIASSMEMVLNDLRSAGIIDDHKLVSSHSVIMDPAYVHITEESITDVTKKKALLSNSNIFSIGRYGSWTYCSIEDNIIEAKELANSLK